MSSGTAVIFAMVPFLNPGTHNRHKHELNQMAKQRNAVNFLTLAWT